MIKEIYNKLKGKPILVTLRNEDGTYSKGYGIVCGYQENWLIVGFDHEFNGCIKPFSNHVNIDDNNYKSYRFWNITHLEEYNTDTSAHYPNRGNDIVRTCIKDEVQESVDKEPLR